MKSLHSLIPGQSKENEELSKSNEVEKKEEKEEKKVVAVVEEQPPPSKPQPPEILYETDQNRINGISFKILVISQLWGQSSLKTSSPLSAQRFLLIHILPGGLNYEY